VRNPRFRRARDGAGLAVLAALTAAATGFAACSDEAAPAAPQAGPSGPPAAPDAARLAALRAIQARFPRALDAAGTTPLAAGDDGALRAAGGLRVELPADGRGAVRLADPASDVSASFTLEGARVAKVAPSAGLAIYAGAAPSGGDVIHRVTQAGTEDFVHYAATPAAERLRYRLDVAKVAGLRLVGGALEMLDGRGAPRIRVAPPEVVEASGKRVAARLAVEGCAVDTSERAPWGRAVTPPGAASCAVVVSWSGVAYPALVDPAWVSAKTMVVERARHALATLPNPVNTGDGSPVLITGGFDKNGLPLSAAEIYEPLSRTFAATGSMLKPRVAHTATALAASPVGHVFVAGGATALNDPLPPEKLAIVSLSDAASTELYNPLTGAFTLGPPMSAPRFQHTATALGDGRVLLVGGITDLVNQPTKSADLFTFDAATPPGTITATAGGMQFARSAHAATRLASGDVLVTGGIGSATFALLSAEIYCATAGCSGSLDHFTTLPTQMTGQRAFHTAVALANGDVLVAGGLNAVSIPITYQASADLYTGGAFLLAAIPMGARAFHTATQLAPAQLVVPNAAVGTVVSAEVILAGGFDGTADLSTVEAYVPATRTIQALGSASLSASRRHAAALLVNAGQSTLGGRAVLVTGGVSGSGPISSTYVNGHAAKSAEVLFKSLGEACAAGLECLSGFCADGVCCDVGCTQECWSCTAALKNDGSADGTCGPSKAGELLPVYCFEDPVTNEHVETHNVCNDKGEAKPGPGTKSCKPATCGADGRCSEVCGASTDCASTGWCDLDSPPDGGAPDGGTGPYGSCRDKKPIGLGCKANVECSSAFCVDGYCCDSQCGEQCQACDIPGLQGKCLATLKGEQPHPNTSGDVPRQLCEGQGTACIGACDGATATKCAYPAAADKSLQEDDCADHDGAASTLTHYPCDQKGGSTQEQTDCGGFKCEGAHTCEASCAADADCIQDHVCLEADGGGRVCAALTAPLCDGVKTLRKPVADGGYTACDNHYACPAGADACLTKCGAIQDCVDGYVCNGSHECVLPLAAPELPSCTAAATSGRGGAGWAALCGLLVLAARRRRRP
jgi:hypothetical protein